MLLLYGRYAVNTEHYMIIIICELGKYVYGYLIVCLLIKNKIS